MSKSHLDKESTKSRESNSKVRQKEQNPLVDSDEESVKTPVPTNKLASSAKQRISEAKYLEKARLSSKTWQILVTTLDTSQDTVEEILEESGITNPGHKQLFRQYLNNMVTVMLDTFNENTESVNILDVEKKEIKYHYTEEDFELKQRNDEHLARLKNRLSRVQYRQAMMEEDIKQQLNTKVSALISHSLSNELLIKTNIPAQVAARRGINSTQLIELEEFIQREKRRYNEQVKQQKEVLTNLDDLFTKSKYFCSRLYLQVSQRLKAAERVGAALKAKRGFGEGTGMEPYEEILWED